MEHGKLAKVMEFCDHSRNFTNFVPELYQICTRTFPAPKDEGYCGFD